MQIYNLMIKDTPLLSFTVVGDRIEDIVGVYNTKLLPEEVKLLTPLCLRSWLCRRVADTTRASIQFMFYKLNLNTSDTLGAILFNKALSLTDHYWVKEIGGETKYSDISLRTSSHQEDITSIALGKIDDTVEITDPTPELTNIGSFIKAWCKKSDGWYLVKQGTLSNHFAEIFTYKLGEKLGLNMAKYLYLGDNIASKSFVTEGSMLELYASFSYRFHIMTYDENGIYNALKEIGDFLANDYTDILLLDAIVCNPDRHEENWGVLKDVGTGEILGLAPNFDNNLALNISHSFKVTQGQLKDYLNTFGILPHQKQWVSKLTSLLLQTVYEETLEELKCEDTFKSHLIGVTDNVNLLQTK